MSFKDQLAAGCRTECIGPAEVASLRRRRWIGRLCGARLARCTQNKFVEMCRRGDFGPNPDRPARRLVAEYRLGLEPASPYLDALAFDHVITAGGPSPEVAEWGCRHDEVIVEHHHTLVEAVARAAELKVCVALVVNDPLSGRMALTGAAAVARRNFPDAALRVLGDNLLSPDLLAHGWDALPTDTADLGLDELYRQFLINMRPGGVLCGKVRLDPNCLR